MGLPLWPRPSSGPLGTNTHLKVQPGGSLPPARLVQHLIPSLALEAGCTHRVLVSEPSAPQFLSGEYSTTSTPLLMHFPGISARGRPVGMALPAWSGGPSYQKLPKALEQSCSLERGVSEQGLGNHKAGV